MSSYNKRVVATLSASAAGVARVGGQGAETDMFAIGFNWMENQSFRAEEEEANPLRRSQTEAVYFKGRVRRLTPVECERLQGFPDNYTLVPHRNKPAADGPRYKALGNSMAVPCMRWIGERIDYVDKLLKQQESEDAA